MFAIDVKCLIFSSATKKTKVYLTLPEACFGLLYLVENNKFTSNSLKVICLTLYILGTGKKDCSEIVHSKVLYDL